MLTAKRDRRWCRLSSTSLTCWPRRRCSPPFLTLPGAAFASWGGWLGAKDVMPPRGWGIALLFSFAVLPVALSLVARFAGLDVAVAVQLVLAAAGIPATRKMGWPPLWSVLGLLACSLVVGWATIDFRFGGSLYQPTVAVDMVKHVATVNSMLSWGLPLTDPFVSRVQPAGYYYFFYTLAAVPVRLTMGVIDARAGVRRACCSGRRCGACARRAALAKGGAAIAFVQKRHSGACRAAAVRQSRYRSQLCGGHCQTCLADRDRVVERTDRALDTFTDLGAASYPCARRRRIWTHSDCRSSGHTFRNRRGLGVCLLRGRLCMDWAWARRWLLRSGWCR